MDLSGSWDVEENVTITIYVDGEFEDEISQSGSGTITITQNGCKFSYFSEVPNPFDPDSIIRILRTGTIMGDTVVFTGKALASAPPEASCSTDVINGTGTLIPTAFGARIQFATTGLALCRGGGETARAEIEGEATFTTDRSLDFPPEVTIHPSSLSVSNVLTAEGVLMPGPNVTFAASVIPHSSVLGFQWLHNGKSIPRATNETLTLTNVRCTQAGTYLLKVRTPQCTLSGNPAILTVNGSTNSVDAPPMLTVSQPSGASTRISNQVATIRGTARDTRGLAGIYLQAGSGPFTRVSVNTNWSAAVNLSPGTNVVRIKAVDACGNASPIITRTLVFVVTSPLTLQVGPGGKVTGPASGQLLEVGRRYTLTAMPSNGFRFTGWSGDLVSTNPVLAFLMPSNLMVQANFADAQRPTVAITLPANNSRISNAVTTVRGTASDNAGVTAVLWQLNGEPFVPAAGTTSWVATVTLVPGTNRFVVKSVDAAGHESLLASNRFVFVPSSPLTLVVGAGGKVSGATNGQLFALGTNYTLTAMASNGFVFSNWTGGLLAYTNVLKFVMTSNLLLEANFVLNPFPAVAGEYNGLFYDTNDVQHSSSGFFTAMVRPGGAFSASLKNGQNKFSFSGAFNLEGKATNQVTRRGANALTVELCLDLQEEDQIIGKVSDGTWTAQLIADRAVFNARTNAATMFARKYTLIIPGSTNGMVSPGGDGFGTITVDAGSTVNFTGSLADGTPATQRVPLSKNGEWPLYVSLYSGRGSVLSWVTFTNRPSDDLHGLLSWIKPSLPLAKYYPMGFTNQTLLEGSIYVPPGTNRVLNLTNGVVVLSGGSLNQSSTNEVVLGANNKVTNLSSNKLTLTIVPATGLFSGSVTPVGSPKTIPIKGVSLQKQNFGSGYFLGTNRSGQVWFGPPE